MAESDYVSILEAARRCGVSDKTIQRAIRRGLLPAQYPQPNRCVITISDLDTFKPGHVQSGTKRRLAESVSGHVQGETEQRLAALEQRVQHLEQQVEELLSKQEGSKPLRQAKARERTTGPLPKHLVSLLAFANQQNVSEQKVLTHVTMDMPLLPAKRGEWTDKDGTVVTLALDVRGRAAFSQLYQEFPSFSPCEQCPHGYQDTVQTAKGPMEVEKKGISSPRHNNEGKKEQSCERPQGNAIRMPAPLA